MILPYVMLPCLSVDRKKTNLSPGVGSCDAFQVIMPLGRRKGGGCNHSEPRIIDGCAECAMIAMVLGGSSFQSFIPVQIATATYI
jgi:hypothetical protein